MKKTLLSVCMLGLSAVAMAQPAGGFGGFQVPQDALSHSAHIAYRHNHHALHVECRNASDSHRV